MDDGLVFHAWFCSLSEFGDISSISLIEASTSPTRYRQTSTIIPAQEVPPNAFQLWLVNLTKNMAKRTISAIMGLLAILAALAAIGYAVELFDDFRTLPGQFWFDVAAEGVWCLMGFVAFGIAIRLLVFAATGHEGRNPFFLKLVLWGAGMFFPGFLFSVPLTLFCASRIWGWNDRHA